MALAQRLRAESNAEEATLRCAMSRAYYAAHHRVKATFPELRNNPKQDRESFHEFVIRRAAEYGRVKTNPCAKEARVIAERLDKARRERNAADYSLDAPLSPYAVNELFKKAELVLQLCDVVESPRASTV